MADYCRYSISAADRDRMKPQCVRLLRELQRQPGSTHRQRGVHLSERFIDDYFSIGIGNAVDGIVYLDAATLHLSVSPIRSQLFRFFIPSRVGIIVGHDKPSPSNPVSCTQ